MAARGGGGRGGGVTGGWLLQCPEPGKKEVPRDGGAVAGAGHSFDYLLTALSPSSPGWAAPGLPVCHSWAARRGSQSLSTGPARAHVGL